MGYSSAQALLNAPRYAILSALALAAFGLSMALALVAMLMAWVSR